MEHPTRIGKYEVEQFLGGGMSRVYRATDSVLGRRVAIKVLTEEATKDLEAKARFLQEARLASNISHDNIISVYDFGEESGLPFMVMEFLEGESLRQSLDHVRAGDLRRKLEIALFIGRALDHIHSKHIVHRDIKPENIHLDVSGRVKLMDFGIAKAQNLKLTRAGFTLGTPYYMAPEQVLGQDVTPQTDIYSFGILLYEMLAGVRPFVGEGYEKIFQQTLYEQPSTEPLKAASVPQPVIQLVIRMLAKQPDQRVLGFGAVCTEIEAILQRLVPVKAGPKSGIKSGLTGMPAAGSAVSKNPISKDSTKGAGKESPKSMGPPTAKSTSLSGQSVSGQNISGQNQAPGNQPMSAPNSAQDLPAFLQSLPAPLRSSGGLMILSALVVLVLLAIIFLVISRLI